VLPTPARELVVSKTKVRQFDASSKWLLSKKKTTYKKFEAKVCTGARLALEIAIAERRRLGSGTIPK
jgi:hypothetical protein